MLFTESFAILKKMENISTNNMNKVVEWNKNIKTLS